MAGEWATKTIAECASPEPYSTQIGPFGEKLKAHSYTPSGVPVLRGTNVNPEGRFHDDDFVFIDPAGADAEFEKFVCEAGDVVLCHKGTLGKIGIIPEGSRFSRYVMGNSMLKVRCDQTKLEPLYLYYWLSSKDGQDYLFSRVSQVGVPQIQRPLSTLREATLPVPPIPDQRAIAHILGTLDDKIELNRRMSETLEAMARALFKSWFVDFDPVRAKAEGRDPGLPKPLAALFPARLVHSDLGEIPEGWEVHHFGEVVEQVRDNENPLASPEVAYRHFSLPAFDDGQWPKQELGESIKSQKSRVLPGVVLLSKLNPEIERVWLVDVRPEDHAVCSTEFMVLQARQPHGRSYAYCLARSPVFRQQIEGLVTGTSKSHQRAQVDSILGLAVVRPSDQLVQRFERAAEPLLQRTLACRRESRTLAAQRETLLPKLISGELRVGDPERFLEAASP
ncbi:MAG TPA: restriction endonuclease subunit S [Candidatus Krumholzibacteria bacterium]